MSRGLARVGFALAALGLLAGCPAPPAPAPFAEYPEPWRGEIRTLEERLQVTPGDGEKLARLTGIFRRLGLFERAAARGAAFIERFPGPASVPVRYERVELLLAARDWPAAGAELEAIGRLTGDPTRMRLNLAAVAERRGDTAAAETLLAAALAGGDSAGRVDALLALGDYRRRQRDWPAARGAYAQALAAAPGELRAAHRFGLLARDEGNDPEAVRCFTAVVREGGNHPLVADAALALGQLALVRGELTEAEAQLAAAAALRPQEAAPLYWQARLSLLREEPFAALNLLNRALLLEPRSARCCELQGDILARGGETPEPAADKYRQALALEDEPRVRFKLGCLLLAHRRLTEAEPELATVAAGGGLLGSLAAFNLGVLAHLNGATDRAAAVFAAVPATSELHQRARHNLAILELHRRRYAEAIAAGEEYLSREAADPRMISNLAVGYFATGDTLTALQLIGDARRLAALAELDYNERKMKGEG